MHRKLIAGFALCSLALPAAAEAAPEAPKLSVMTRNIYLGADIARPIGSTTVEEFEQKNQIVWDTVVKTNFPARAKLLAKEIKETKPDLIGLQEVALWRKGPKGSSAPATNVAYDYLKLLQRAVRARGLNYRVANVQQEANVEGPTTSDGDVRLTMRDVILVKKRRGLRITGKGGGNFEAEIAVDTPPGPVKVKRGYTFVNAALKGIKFRFVNTHLEAFLDTTRLAQVNELVGENGPTDTKLPMILVGDMNSDAKGDPDGEGDPKPYNVIRRAGFRDAWTEIRGRDKGYVCCLRRETADDPPPFPADHRIDHIFTKRGQTRIRGLSAEKVGIDRRNRTESGLWPSDHGGWVGTFRLIPSR